jgi:hypothetical protein
MSRFSKGRWKLQQGGNANRYIYAAERTQPICRPLQSASEIPREEFEANVALIEDAPEMYKLLSQMVATLEGTGKYSLEMMTTKAKAMVGKHS